MKKGKYIIRTKEYESRNITGGLLVFLGCYWDYIGILLGNIIAILLGCYWDIIGMLLNWGLILLEKAPFARASAADPTGTPWGW